MGTSGALDRREFLTVSALTTAAALVGESLHAAAPPPPGHVSLAIVGDAQQGYGVTILYRGRPIARHNHGGEFSAVFQNSERSLEDRSDDWRASSWSGDHTKVTLIGQLQLSNLRTTVFVEVRYEVMPLQVVKKTVQLRQADSFALFYQLTNQLEPAEPPAKLWSFDHAECKGGALREYFPAAGFRTHAGLTFGLLTDSGYRNLWSRVIRRDGTPVKPAPARVPDLNLYSLPSSAERIKRGAFIRHTFGEATVQISGESSRTVVDLPMASGWTRRGEIEVQERDGVVKLSLRHSEAYVLLPFPAKGGEIYAVCLKYRCSVPLAVRAWDTDDQLQEVGDLTLFNDTAPASPSAFTEFRNSFVVPTLQGTGAALILALPDISEEGARGLGSGGLPAIEVRDLTLHRVGIRTEPYHRLQMGQSQFKTVFLFADETVQDMIGGYRLASQLHLADALGFRGGRDGKGALRGCDDAQLERRSGRLPSNARSQHLVLDGRRDVSARQLLCA